MTPDTIREERVGVGRFVIAGYLVAACFLLLQLIDMFTAALPIAPAIVTWRYGSIGTAAQYMISLIFGLYLGIVIAAFDENDRMRKFWGILATVSGVITMLLAIEFVLDFFQVKTVVRPDAKFSFKVGAAKAEFKLIVSGLTLLYMGIKAWRNANPLPKVLYQPQQGRNASRP